MMIDKKFIAVAIGAMLIVPGIALGEETSASGGVATDATLSADGTGAGATTDTTAAGTATPVPPKPMLIRESPTLQSTGGVKSPRDAASGQATGKRMNGLPPSVPKDSLRMGSGTRPLPQKIEDRMEKRDQRMDERASSSEARKDRMQEARHKMLAKRFEVLKRMIAQQIGRMEAMIERLGKISDRLDSRITKLKAKGVDTSATAALLVTARAKAAEATVALADAKLKAEAIVAASVSVGDVDGDGTDDVVASGEESTTDDTVKHDTAKAVREALIKAREAVMAAHKALTQAVASLNASVKLNATTTATTETTTN